MIIECIRDTAVLCKFYEQLTNLPELVMDHPEYQNWECFYAYFSTSIFGSGSIFDSIIICKAKVTQLHHLIGECFRTIAIMAQLWKLDLDVKL